MNSLTLCADDTFGPAIKTADCRGGFDFTVTFENIILAGLPAALFITLTIFRILNLRHAKLRIRQNSLHASKLIFIAFFTALQITNLVLTAATPALRTRASLASAALSVLAAVTLGMLSHLEHVRSIKPSLIINLYLIVTVLLDAVRVRTHWLVAANKNSILATVMTSSLAVKFVILILEATGKRSFLPGSYGQFSLENTSGLFSRSSFWWLNSLLTSGHKRVLGSDDLPIIHEKLNSAHLSDRLKSVWDTCDQRKRYALARACVWSLRWEVFVIYIPKICYAALSIAQVYLIQNAVTFVQGSVSASTGYGLIGGFALVYIGLAVMMGWASHLSYRLMTMMRAQLTTVIYTKLLTLPISSTNESAAISLMGTDVQRIAETFWQLIIEALPSVAQLGVAVYLLYAQLGAVCVAPVLVTIISTGLSVFSAGIINSRQGAWLEAVQDRVNYTSEILGSIKSVKILGLISQLTQRIHNLRNIEIETSKKYRRVQSLNISLVNLPETFNTFVIFAAYALAAHLQKTGGLSVSQAITSLAALNLLSVPLATLLYAIPQGWSALGCFERIQQFLLQPSRTDQRTFPHVVANSISSQSDCDFELQGTTLARQNRITASAGTFGWSDASPRVVKVDTPVELTYGLTVLVGPVGSGKSTLLKGIIGETPKISGRVHISSPEVAYVDQSAWAMNGSIRDNIVAGTNLAFDEKWYRAVCHACVLDVDFREIPHGDMTLVGSKGVKLSGGQRQRLSIARALYSRKKLAVFDDVLAGLDLVTERLVFQRVFGHDGLLRKIGATVVLATHSVKHLSQADFILVLDENGTLIKHGTFFELNTTERYIHNLQLRLEEEPSDHSDRPLNDGSQGEFEQDATPSATAQANETRKTGDWLIYKYYLRALGPLSLVLFLGFVSVTSVSNAMSHVWLNWWAEWNQNGGAPNLGYWLGILGLINIMAGTSMVGAVTFLWTFMIPQSGRNLHQSLLEAVRRAPLSFFSNTETGVLVNRFSQDLRYADMTIPGSIINMSFQLGTCLVSVALSATAVGFFAAILPVVFGLLYLIQNFYLRTSRQLRLLEIEASAPVFTHFIDSLAGLDIIRSYAWTEVYISKNVRLVDSSLKPYYLLLCIQRWLVLVLDLVVAGLAVVLVGMAVSLRSSISPGFLGLALVNMMGLSHSLTKLVQHWTNLETSLGAIARIKNFSETTPEEASPGETSNTLSSEWPHTGALIVEGLSACYGGKSSTALAILRLMSIISGRILLDNVDLTTIPGSVVRERLVCLTQDPFMFSGSLRLNIDPVGTASDESCVSALQRVGLWEILKNTVANPSFSNASCVLDARMSMEMLSHGQRQLFCLARAMLQQGKVLILDEPTSSVDAETDARMQDLIRTEFQHHTIIMIAHRLSSVLDFDKVAVLDHGNLVEFGKPAQLLMDGSSHFSKLYNSSTSS
ncbi:hypothetical protein JX266_012324 [Neoarthrinium moseri]|nr:hypothetical protein JX266_012324 [Neoarthrinium moseri]